MSLDLPPIQSIPASSLANTAIEGASLSAERMNKVAQQLSAGEITPANMVGLKEQAALYAINMKLIKTADETVGQLLNLRA